MTYPFIIIFVLFFLPACGGPARIHWLDADDPAIEPAPDTSGEISLVVSALYFEQESPLVLREGESMNLSLTISLSNGEIYHGIKKEFDPSNDNLEGDIGWFSNNGQTASVTNEGILSANKEGATTVHARLFSRAAAIDVIVTGEEDAVEANVADQESPDDVGIEEISQNANDVPNSGPTVAAETGQETGTSEASVAPIVEPPLSTPDYFLGTNDFLDISYGVNAGYGQHLFPAIAYGPPRTGGTHVVSLGGGGVIDIELHGYVVTNGQGPDFTVFENAVVSPLYGNFFERARVSISRDGESFFSFPCEAFDPEEIYEGCAGVAPVDASANPLNPLVSGGDVFDLSEVGLDEASFIRIEDLDTCHPGDPTYLDGNGNLLCGISGQQGFDLDAIAIVNGRNE